MAHLELPAHMTDYDGCMYRNTETGNEEVYVKAAGDVLARIHESILAEVPEASREKLRGYLEIQPFYTYEQGEVQKFRSYMQIRELIGEGGLDAAWAD